LPSGLNPLAKPLSLAQYDPLAPMPTYEYECPKCGYHFEHFQSMKDEPLKRCPKCKKLGLKRLIGGGAGLIFKGSGFYITDYKKTTPPKEGGEGKGGSGETKAGGDAKPSGESKAAPSEKSSSGESKGSSGGGKPPAGESKSSGKK
jgi:putative FmdB family regulatory protein